MQGRVLRHPGWEERRGGTGGLCLEPARAALAAASRPVYKLVGFLRDQPGAGAAPGEWGRRKVVPQTSFGSPNSHSISTALCNVERHQLHAEGQPLPALGQQAQAPPGAASSSTGGTAGSSVSGIERQISRSPWKSSCQPPTSAALPALSPLSQHLPEAQRAAEEQKAAGIAESFHVGLLGSGVHSQLSVSENLFPFCFPRQKFREGNAGLSGGGHACPPSAAVLQTLSCWLYERAGCGSP